MTAPEASEHTEGLQLRAEVTSDADGDFVVVWSSNIDADGSVAPLTDGLLVLRFLFGFTGATLTSGAVDTQNCARCDATAIQAYLQTLI